MPEPRVDFLAESVAGLPPEAMDAMVAANAGLDMSYGGDRWSRRASDLVRAKLDVDAPVWFVGSGTGANALALSMLARPFEAVLTYEQAHVLCDEAGAPGHFGHGLGLVGLPGEGGLIDLAAMGAALAADRSRAQPIVGFSLANLTEFGRVYDDDAFRARVDAARDAGLAVHVDGARLANAEAAGFDPRLIGRSGVEVAVMGGAKPGGASVEALVVTDSARATHMDARLKQAGQVFAKPRLQVASLVGLLESGGWLTHALHAARQAKRIADAIMTMPGLSLRYPVDANMIFVNMLEPVRARMTSAGWVLPVMDGAVRMVTHWATSDEAVEELLGDLAAAVA